MSQNDESENDIWDYKPLKKQRKPESPLASEPVTKRRCLSKRTSKGHTSSSTPSPVNKIYLTARSTKRNKSEQASVISKEEKCTSDALTTLSSNPGIFQTSNNNDEGPSSGEYCPVCQMPFSILVVQSQRWHVLDCLDFSRDKCKECPDGLLCASTFPNHYRNYNHTLLAQSRGAGDVLPPQSTTRETSHVGPAITEETNHSGPVEKQMDRARLKTPQNSPRHPLLSPCSSSSLRNHPKLPKISNGLFLLRSPKPEDLKKKKGWSSPKVHQSVSSCRESKRDILTTPSKTASEAQAFNSVHKCALSSSEIDDAISYSPLSELPAELEVSQAGPRKKLFNSDQGGSGNAATLNAQVDSVTSSLQSNQEAANKAVEKCEKEKPGTSTSVVGSSEISIQSPQSIVLERLRETISNSEKPVCKSSAIQSEIPDSDKVPLSKTMTSQKTQGKAGQSMGLKQTDIGVFFGLKPLQDKVTKTEPQELQLAVTESKKQEGKTQMKGRQRKNQANTTAENAQSTSVENGARGETKQNGARGWRRRGTSATTDGEVVKFRCCPFYKKIPGTKLVVDAFRYGLIEGITAYFLTHFHSDHYDGLNKKSTCPIYCNIITGNLVKSKLKVPEQYVHILPMNTEVIVEGIKVILLEANHCPGAAMLLFSLPDGQTVLHTGDFRADPSMETYPELLSCRVQTLYLDTTYCSPEYTFPKQQEVINYAASTAFELVTLNPRTLVVCGSYSVGKEKVFLALANVLGSKVCLSRDKYNTMCCLESEEVRQCITTDWKAAQVHVLPMMQLSFKKLQDHLARFSAKYDKLVAFKPTGWTFSQQVESVEYIQPQIKGDISIYGIPYSEHSSFLELKRFVQWLRPLKIIPTVNNGSWESRKAMERCFSEWQMEVRAKL